MINKKIKRKKKKDLFVYALGNEKKIAKKKTRFSEEYMM